MLVKVRNCYTIWRPMLSVICKTYCIYERIDKRGCTKGRKGEVIFFISVEVTSLFRGIFWGKVKS